MANIGDTKDTKDVVDQGGKKVAKLGKKAGKKLKNKVKKAGKKKIMAIFSTVAGPVLIPLFALIFIFIILVNITPGLIWNALFHVNEKVDRVPSKAEQRKEKSEDRNTVIARENEMLEVVNGALVDAHDKLMQKTIPQTLKSKYHIRGKNLKQSLANIDDQSTIGLSEEGDDGYGGGMGVGAGSLTDYIKKYTGPKYIWGGETLRGHGKNRIDCSGFVKVIYKRVFGLNVTHQSGALRHEGKKVKGSSRKKMLENAHTGDIICYSGHVSIFIKDNKNGTFTEAESTTNSGSGAGSGPNPGVQFDNVSTARVLSVRTFPEAQRKLKEMKAAGTSGTFRWPLKKQYHITDDFGSRPSRGKGSSTYHLGIDIGAPQGTPILASDGGKVTKVHKWSGSRSDRSGNYVEIKHSNGWRTRYKHMVRKSHLKVGQKVKKGQKIGIVGNTGNSFGAHLHFEIVNKKGKEVDPEKWLNKSVSGDTKSSSSEHKKKSKSKWSKWKKATKKQYEKYKKDKDNYKVRKHRKGYQYKKKEKNSDDEVENTGKNKAKKVWTRKNGGLPKNVSGKTKSYMCYTAVTCTSSNQWKFFHRKKNRPKADSKKYMRVGEDYCVALGSYYGTHIGKNRYRITFKKSNGKTYQITATLGDQKANKDTDKKHQYHTVDHSIVEFITGSYPHEQPTNDFPGSVVKIELIGGNADGIAYGGESSEGGGLASGSREAALLFSGFSVKHDQLFISDAQKKTKKQEKKEKKAEKKGKEYKGSIWDNFGEKSKEGDGIPENIDDKNYIQSLRESKQAPPDSKTRKKIEGKLKMTGYTGGDQALSYIKANPKYIEPGSTMYIRQLNRYVTVEADKSLGHDEIKLCLGQDKDADVSWFKEQNVNLYLVQGKTTLGIAEKETIADKAHDAASKFKPLASFDSLSKVKRQLKHDITSHEDCLYKVTYGPVKGGVMQSIKIRDADLEQVASGVFGLDPDGEYTIDGEGQGTTNKQAIKTLTDGHMQMLYNKYGKTAASDEGEDEEEEDKRSTDDIIKEDKLRGKWPFDSSIGKSMITTSYKQSGKKYIEIAVPEGTSVYSSTSGTVVGKGKKKKVVSNLPKLLWRLTVRHKEELNIKYEGLRYTKVKNTEKVKKGQILGASGENVVRITAKIKGKTINPMRLYEK